MILAVEVNSKKNRFNVGGDRLGQMAKKRMIQRILEKSIKFKIIFSQKISKRNEYKTKKKTDKFCIASLKKKKLKKSASILLPDPA